MNKNSKTSLFAVFGSAKRKSKKKKKVNIMKHSRAIIHQLLLITSAPFPVVLHTSFSHPLLFAHNSPINNKSKQQVLSFFFFTHMHTLLFYFSLIIKYNRIIKCD
jgi:hypothetical protein